jgi:hypothetical protein
MRGNQLKPAERNATKIRDDGQAMLLPVCDFCNQVPEQGIKGVMRVGKAWLCQACESRIIQMEVGSPDYEVMLEKMKNIWKHPKCAMQVF